MACIIPKVPVDSDPGVTDALPETAEAQVSELRSLHGGMTSIFGEIAAVSRVQAAYCALAAVNTV